MTLNNTNNWKQELQDLINEFNKYRIDGKVASFKTQEDRAKYLFKFLQDIRYLGFKVGPYGIKEKHILAICQKFEADKLEAPKIQTYISFLRALCIWIGKPNMVKDVKKYFKDPDIIKRQYAALTDKSWDKPEIDKYAILEQIRQYNIYVYIQLLVCDAFGLRKKEAICLKPHLFNLAEHIEVRQGAKGGRERDVPVDSQYQELVLAKAKLIAMHKHAYLGDPLLNLKQNMKKFSNTMTKFGIKKVGFGALGITAHGLRAGYGIREFEANGITPTIKGGALNQLPKDEENRIRRDVSERLGHSRIQVTAAYAGAFTQVGVNNANKQKERDLANMLDKLVEGTLYEFELAEHELENNQLIPAIKITRTFLEKLELNGDVYLVVLRNEDEKIHNIKVDVILSISDKN